MAKKRYVSGFLNTGFDGPQMGQQNWNWAWGAPGGLGYANGLGQANAGFFSMPGMPSSPLEGGLMLENPAQAAGVVDLFPERTIQESIAAIGGGGQQGALNQVAQLNPGVNPNGTLAAGPMSGVPTAPLPAVVDPPTPGTAGGMGSRFTNGTPTAAPTGPGKIMLAGPNGPVEMNAALAAADQKNFANNIQLANTIIGGAQVLGNIGMGAYQLYQAGRMFDFQSALANRNLANQAQAYNDARADRMRGRVSANYYADHKEEVDREIEKKKVDGSAIPT